MISEKTIFEKLQLKSGRGMVIIDPPQGFLSHAGELPPDATISLEPTNTSLLLAFLPRQQELNEKFLSLASLVSEGGIFWIAYPKLSSKLSKDLNRDLINQFAAQQGWTGVAMIALDEDWSALRLKRI